MWTVQNAKAKLSEVLRLAKAGEPQIIGASDPCVVLSIAEYRRLTDKGPEQKTEPVHLGRWLLANIPRGLDIEVPPRDDNRPDPFADV